MRKVKNETIPVIVYWSAIKISFVQGGRAADSTSPDAHPTLLILTHVGKAAPVNGTELKSPLQATGASVAHEC